MDKMAEAYISLAALPAPDKANEMPFPSSLRRSTKLFDKVLCLTFSQQLCLCTDGRLVGCQLHALCMTLSVMGTAAHGSL